MPARPPGLLEPTVNLLGRQRARPAGVRGNQQQRRWDRRMPVVELQREHRPPRQPQHMGSLQADGGDKGSEAVGVVAGRNGSTVYAAIGWRRKNVSMADATCAG
jgi:hypothetical protein